MKARLALVVLVTAVSAIAGCSRPNEAPSSTGPDPTPVVGWSGPGIRNVCVESAATFEGQPVASETVSELFNVDVATDLWNLPVVPAGGACDAMLRIELSGAALSGVYGGEQLYVGYDINGVISLAAPNQPPLSFPYAARHDPAPTELVSDPGPTEPTDALALASLAEHLYNAMVQFLGPFPTS